jgi:hypothetical protein
MNNINGSQYSLYFEKLVEHRFISDMMTYCLYKEGITLEIIHAEIDTNGYDLILSYKNINRYIQLKTSEEGSTTSSQKINLLITEKENPCIIWIIRHYDNKMNDFRFKYLFWGSNRQELLPNIGKYKIAKHTKANSSGIKKQRQNIRIIPKGDFIEINSIEGLFEKLFHRISLQKEVAFELACSVGYNMYTIPNKIHISELKAITKKHIENLILRKKEKEDMEILCNMNTNDLVGKFFDKNGNIYYETERQINQFTLKIDDFKKIYKSKNNGA